MKQAKKILLLLTAIFLCTEIFFLYLFIDDRDIDILGVFFKTCIFLLLILLFSKKLTWAKWTLSVLLILYGLLIFVSGIEFPALFAIGLFDIFFGVYIHTSKALAVFRTAPHTETEPSAQLVEEITEAAREPNVAQSTEAKQHFKYPQLVRRYKALLIDFMLMFATLIIIMLLVQDSELRTPIMVTAAAIICLTYEPVLTAYSRTIGQKLMRIRVGRNDNPLEKINLLNAYARWATKFLLGWVSFITIHFNPERRAIHDLASDSVMTVEE